MGRIDELVAENIMAKSLMCVGPDQILAELRRGLIDSKISGVPVVDDDGRLIGIVTRSDVSRVQVLMEALDGHISDQLSAPEDSSSDALQRSDDVFGGFRQRIDQMRVKDAMRTQVITCTLSTPIAEVASKMMREHIHRIVVVDDRRPVGIISSLDLVALLSEEPAS